MERKDSRYTECVVATCKASWDRFGGGVNERRFAQHRLMGMTGEIERLLTELSAAGVRYLVVGGVAVVLHGYARSTSDLDVVIDLEPENVERALRLFENRGFRPRPPVALRSFADAAERHRWIREKNLQVFTLWHPELPFFAVDIFVTEPFPFDEAYQRTARARVGESIVTVASIDDLIAMKRVAGRAQDAMDIEILLELKKPVPPADEIRDAPFDGSFGGTRRRQSLLGRTLATTDRLRWLERHMAELRSLQGRAS